MTTETGVSAACANNCSFASHALTGVWLAFARVWLAKLHVPPSSDQLICTVYKPENECTAVRNCREK